MPVARWVHCDLGQTGATGPCACSVAAPVPNLKVRCQCMGPPLKAEAPAKATRRLARERRGPNAPAPGHGVQCAADRGLLTLPTNLVSGDFRIRLSYNELLSPLKVHMHGVLVPYPGPGTTLSNVGPEQLEAAEPKLQPVRAAAS